MYRWEDGVYVRTCIGLGPQEQRESGRWYEDGIEQRCRGGERRVVRGLIVGNRGLRDGGLRGRCCQQVLLELHAYNFVSLNKSYVNGIVDLPG
jgi:hypothetical protein